MAGGIHELQRAMMTSSLHKEKTRNAAALAGKPRARRREEGGHYPPPYPRGGAPLGTGGGVPTSSEVPTGNYRPGRTLDVHEILKHEAFASSAATCDDHFEKSRPCPSAVYGVSDQYMILDSFEKVETSRGDKGEFQFNFMVQGVTRDQNIGVKDRLDTIIGIQVCDFCIPLLPFDVFDPDRLTTLTPGLATLGLAANGPLPTTGTPVNNPQSQTPFCSRVTMFLKEIGLQSYSDADNRRHHFEFDATVAGPGRAATTGPGPPGPPGPPGLPAILGDRILLTPLDDCEYYLFTDPIQDVHGLTVCFYNPGNPLRFPPDCLYGAAAQTNAGQYLEFTYNDPTNLINLLVGDRIYVREFEAVAPATGAAYSTLNSYVTRPEGHLVGTGGFAIVTPAGPGAGTTVTFRLNPDISTAGLSPPILASTTITSTKRITVCIAKNRLRIPLRFRRVVSRLTNYIAP